MVAARRWKEERLEQELPVSVDQDCRLAAKESGRQGCLAEPARKAYREGMQVAGEAKDQQLRWQPAGRTLTSFPESVLRRTQDTE